MSLSFMRRYSLKVTKLQYLSLLLLERESLSDPALEGCRNLTLFIISSMAFFHKQNGDSYYERTYSRDYELSPCVIAIVIPIAAVRFV